jgi:hypothetical protein
MVRRWVMSLPWRACAMSSASKHLLRAAPPFDQFHALAS